MESRRAGLLPKLPFEQSRGLLWARPSARFAPESGQISRAFRMSAWWQKRTNAPQQKVDALADILTATRRLLD
jgi:hypothetical protein